MCCAGEVRGRTEEEIVESQVAVIGADSRFNQRL